MKPRCDPWAVALGNASLFGVGYLLMRRWQIAIGVVVTTLVLLLIVSTTGQPGWPWRVILLVWWLASIAHGWRLANGRWRPAALVMRGLPRPARRQRIVAAAATLVVLGTLAGLAVDSRRIAASALDAHRAGDCDRATATFGGIGGRHRLVDPWATTRAARTEEACQLLSEALDLVDRRGRSAPAAELLAEYMAHPGALWDGASQRRADLLVGMAADELDGALGGDTGDLAEGVALLAQVLDETPGRGDDVTEVLAGYETGLASASACDARDNADWFSAHPSQLEHPELTRTTDAIEERAPEILLACGEERLSSSTSSGPEEARAIFELVMESYPEHPVAAVAEARITDADDEIVRNLLEWRRDPPGQGDDPPYCFGATERPGYSRAPAYAGEGPHLYVDFGHPYGVVEPSWAATRLDDAVLVVCNSGSAQGTALGRDCVYPVRGGEPDRITVPLHVSAYTIRVFELRTGDLVDETTFEFGGDCPPLPGFGPVPNPEPGPGRQPFVLGPDHALAFSPDSSVQQAIRDAIREWVFP